VNLIIDLSGDHAIVFDHNGSPLIVLFACINAAAASRLLDGRTLEEKLDACSYVN
jgi:hypothetical protein